jgi:hypothetical protein
MKYKIKVIKNYPQSDARLYIYEWQEYESEDSKEEILAKHVHVVECEEIVEKEVKVEPKKVIKKK